jgi:hypothetical protein
MVPIEQSGEPIILAEDGRELGPCGQLIAVRWVRLRRFVWCGSHETRTNNRAAQRTTLSVWDTVGWVFIGLFFCGAGALLSEVTGWETLPVMLGIVGLGSVFGGAVVILMYATCCALHAIGVGRKSANKSEWTQAKERLSANSWRTFERSVIDKRPERQREVQRSVEGRDSQAPPVVAVRQVRVTSIVTAGHRRIGG